MPNAFLTRVVRFSAAHRYYRPEWSETRNRETFGGCSNPVGHGHNYALEVTVTGAVDPATGFCVDLAVLDRLLDQSVRQPLDHQHINYAIPEFGEGGVIPTCENLLVWLWDRIRDGLPEGVGLRRLRLREDVDLWADYYGPGAAPDGG